MSGNEAGCYIALRHSFSPLTDPTVRERFVRSFDVEQNEWKDKVLENAGKSDKTALLIL